MQAQMERYPERESKTLEFKETLPVFSTLIKTCVAFANTAGGQIVIGVEDQSRRIIGVKESDRERLYESFPNSLYDATNNGLFVHIYEKNFNAKSVLVIEVPLSAKRPCFVKQEGIPKGVYLRVGTSTRRALDEHVEELMRESKHQYYDAEITNLLLPELSETRLKACYGHSYAKKKLESDGVIARNRVTPEEYFATIAGVLMFYENPENVIPEATILCTEFSGTSGRKIVQTRELTGPISELISDCLALLEHWLQRHFTLKGAKLMGEMIIPPVALREAVTNALLHRKYTIPGAVKIALYDDRLEIFSPGGFPGLIDINQLGDGTTYLRNPHLAKIARRLKLVEKLGTGIKIIFESCREYGLKKPEYHEEGDFVKLTFTFLPSAMEGDTDEELIMKYIRLHGEVSIGEIISLLSISRNTATRKLNDLIDKGLIIRKGSGPSVKYHLK